MKTTHRTESRDAAEAHRGPCISIYIPSGRAAHDAPPDWVRLRGLLREAEQNLEDRGCPPNLIRDLVAPLYDLNGESKCRQHQSDSLAFFRKPGFFRYHAVPFPVPETAVVADHFYLTPLFHSATGDQPFYLLAISLTGATMFEALAGSVTELRDVQFPASPAAPSDQTDGQRNRHSERSVRSGFAILHRSQARDNRKRALASWFRRIDDIMRNRLGAGCPPVVLVAVQYLCPMFRHVSRYQNLAEREIHGSPDGITPEELWRRGWDIASSYFQAERQRIADEYLRLWHTPRASNDIRDIEVAARQGRIRTLFLGVRHPAETASTAKNELCQTGARAETPAVLQLAALNTFMTGGTVYAVPPEQVPGRASAAAVFRY